MAYQVFARSMKTGKKCTEKQAWKELCDLGRDKLDKLNDEMFKKMSTFDSKLRKCRNLGGDE